ncbi:MAG TPA: hypothetical protein VFF59_06155, partial [Anaerolineae bacterium]|nr:hypothetical protein [Anaerolineae bacterium]
QLDNPQSLHSAMPDVKQCRGCHAEHNGATASLTRLNMTDFPHDRLAFTLAAHKKTTAGQPFVCADCHGETITEFDQTKCETCHREYQADFVTKHAADFGPGCLACHDGVDRFSAFDHNRLKFTLVGKHNEVTCGECHTNVRTVADFKSASPACIDCHRKDDEHRGAFGTDCSVCHTSDDWDNAQFDHNLAAFKLAGKHATVECEQCHVNNVFKGTPQTCVSCHQKDDKHAGAFGADCAQCHNPSNWKDAKFDHNLAAFKLTGAHVNVTCARCHANGVYKGTPQTCVGCHAEPQEHLGAFGLDCAQCHSTQTWQGATFDHAFPLNHGEGGNIACKTCHTTTNFKDYTCYGCHDHTPQNVQARHLEEGISNFQDCVRCHDRGQKEGGE